MASSPLRRYAPLAPLALLALFSFGGSAPADDTFSSATAEIVRLDLVVTDKDGKLVPGLGREDFEVTEDGKPQTLSQFATLGKTRAIAAPPSPAPLAPDSAKPEASPDDVGGAGRWVVLVVDDLHIAPGNIEFTKEAMRRFVNESVGADDSVALVTTSSGEIQQELSKDRAHLKQVINGLTLREISVAAARSSGVTAAQAELILRGDVSALKLAAQSLIHEPGSMFENGAISEALNRGRSVSAGLERNEAAPAEEAKRQARNVLDQALRYSVATLTTVDSVLRGMADLPGRKLCVLVSDGFLVGAGTSEERVREMRSLTDAATRSGTVVYTLDSHGLASTSRDASVSVSGANGVEGLQPGVDAKAAQILRGTLETIARDTGGFLVQGSNDLTAGLRKMLADNDVYYLVAYEPTTKKHDGRFRKIAVRVARHADYVVRTRTGYFAPEDKKTVSPPPPARLRGVPGRAPLSESELRAVLAMPLPTDRVPVHLSADYLSLPVKGSLAVVRAQVDLAGLKWQEADGRFQAALDVAGGVYDKDGQPVGAPFGRHVDLDLPSDARKRAVDEGFQFQQEVALPPGRYQVRFVTHESKLGQAGGAASWVEIPDLGDKKLMISSVFLSGTDASAKAGGAPNGEMFRDAQTLRRFKRGESLYFQLYVYNPLLDEKGASDVILQAQIRSGGKMLAASKPAPAAARDKDGTPLPETNGMSLEGLDAGRYDLRVVVFDRKANVSVQRTVDFTVE